MFSRKSDVPLPVYVGMRNASPFFVETLGRMAKDGIRRALGFILSSHRTEASWDRYQKNVADARVELGPEAPQVAYCSGWHDHPLFIQTWAELIQASFANIPAQIAPEHRSCFHRPQSPHGDGGSFPVRRTA